jgi:hypothetical protein
MNTTTALPPKAEKHTCSECGLTSPAPIVVLIRDKPSDRHASIARCANRKACDLRVLRLVNREKEAKR